MKIALDAGHGLHTAGKRTPDDIREWTLNNTVLLSFEKEIKKYQGVKTVRLDDPSGKTDRQLATRTNLANKEKADYLISFHHNAYQSKWGDHGGTEVWIHNEKSREIANVLLRSTVETLGLRNRGIKVGNLHINKESNMPSALVELGFMDSNTDKVIRDESQRALAGKNMAIAFANHYNLVKPQEKRYITLTGTVDLYDDNSKKYGAPSTTTKEVEVLEETAQWYKVRHSSFSPTDVWVKKQGVNGVSKPSKPVETPKPAPTKKYITLTGRVPLYDDNSKQYGTPSGKTRKVEVLKETSGWYYIRSKDFNPTDVWVKKSDVGGVSAQAPASNVGKYVNMFGQVWLLVSYESNRTYPIPTVNNITNSRRRSAKILEERNGRFKISVPSFSPNIVWVSKSQVSVSDKPQYEVS